MHVRAVAGRQTKRIREDGVDETARNIFHGIDFLPVACLQLGNQCLRARREDRLHRVERPGRERIADHPAHPRMPGRIVREQNLGPERCRIVPWPRC